MEKRVQQLNQALKVQVQATKTDAKNGEPLLRIDLTGKSWDLLKKSQAIIAAAVPSRDGLNLNPKSLEQTTGNSSKKPHPTMPKRTF